MQDLIDLEHQPLATLPARDRILRTASDLFYRFSVHTVGIDRIIAESGVAKMTFYKYFPSKARLIAEYMQDQNAVWLQMLGAATEREGLTPTEHVLAIFDALDGSFQTPPFRGCPFVKGLAEFGPDADSPEVQGRIAAYFQSLHDFVADLISPMGLVDPDKTVLQILSLIQGAIVMAQTMPDRSIAAANRDAAEALLRAATVR